MKTASLAIVEVIRRGAVAVDNGLMTEASAGVSSSGDRHDLRPARDRHGADGGEPAGAAGRAPAPAAHRPAGDRRHGPGLPRLVDHLERYQARGAGRRLHRPRQARGRHRRVPAAVPAALALHCRPDDRRAPPARRGVGRAADGHRRRPGVHRHRGRRRASGDRHRPRRLPAAGRRGVDHRSGRGHRHLPRRRRAQAAVDPGRRRVAPERRRRHRRLRPVHAASWSRASRPIRRTSRSPPIRPVRSWSSCANSWAA